MLARSFLTNRGNAVGDVLPGSDPAGTQDADRLGAVAKETNFTAKGKKATTEPLGEVHSTLRYR